MFVFIASVHHTGTQFTQNLFEQNGFQSNGKFIEDWFRKCRRENLPVHKIIPLDPLKLPADGCFYHRAHIAPSVQTELKTWLDYGFPIVVPLRHPVEVALTWLRKNKPLEEMLCQWQLLIDLVDPYGPLYLPIDHADRERYFYNLRLEIDPKLNTDWAVVGSKRAGSDHPAQEQPVPPGAADIELLLELAHQPVLNQFYPEPWTL